MSTPFSIVVYTTCMLLSLLSPTIAAKVPIKTITRPMRAGQAPITINKFPSCHLKQARPTYLASVHSPCCLDSSMVPLPLTSCLTCTRIMRLLQPHQNPGGGGGEEGEEGEEAPYDLHHVSFDCQFLISEVQFTQ